MAGKGSLWSMEEVNCLLEIWADESIQEQLDKMHKNTIIFRKIRDYLFARGFQRTTEQCRNKVKKLRGQYLKARDALRKSGNNTDEKDKFQWYDAVDNIMGSKPCSQPNVLDFHPRKALDCAPSDTDDKELERSRSFASLHSDSTIASNAGDETQESSDKAVPQTAPLEQGRKRKRKVEVSGMMAAFLDMQKQHHEEFMQGENLRYQQEKEMLDNWMKTQMQMQERRLQIQREERQETNLMFLQTMNRLFDSMIPSQSHHHPHPPATPPHLQHPHHAETSSLQGQQPTSSSASTDDLIKQLISGQSALSRQLESLKENEAAHTALLEEIHQRLDALERRFDEQRPQCRNSQAMCIKEEGA